MIDPPCQYDEVVRNKITGFLDERGWSEADLRGRTTIPAARFKRLMNGEQSFPLKDLWEIGIALGVGVDPLIKDI